MSCRRGASDACGGAAGKVDISPRIIRGFGGSSDSPSERDKVIDRRNGLFRD